MNFDKRAIGLIVQLKCAHDDGTLV